MNAQFYHPETLTGSQLDAFLDEGWYRMHGGLFTTHFIEQRHTIYRVFWLRYNLQIFRAGNTIRKIKTTNRHFSVTIKPLVITDELEKLYDQYKTGIDFEGADSVTGWLYGETPGYNVFDSYVVEIRDGALLIAAGIFDNGENSIAGIINFYHPGYKKFGLGKYIMICKIQHAIANGKQWYYPGYIVHRYPKFDYKLFAGKDFCEVFIPGADKWYQYNKQVVDILGDESFKKEE